MERTTRKDIKSNPIVDFIKNSSLSSMLLFISAFLALIIANSPWHETMQGILSQKIGFTIGDFSLYKPLILWINDGLMSIFFFVVGLELKREIIAGELSNPKNVVMPILAALGGMFFPAVIFLAINSQGPSEPLNGWGIPMATDIAFALGVLYLLGPKVPIQLKVFLTALAIIDDIGAVSVIALFYTSQISVGNLAIGAAILLVMFGANRLGVRNVWLYAVLGIGGLWLAFLLSGVHATIAAVLAAFAIPATRAIDKDKYLQDLRELTRQFETAEKSAKQKFLLSAEEENIISGIRQISKQSSSPLQRLEHGLHPLVAYVVIPIFALSNAGVVLDGEWLSMLTSPVALGVMVGLMLGKFTGIFGLSMLGLRLGFFKMPDNLTPAMLLGVSFLAAIGFTMSLFINSLAFESEIYMNQAKMGILGASLLSGFLGYFILKRAIRNLPEK